MLAAQLDVVPAVGGPRSATLHRYLAIADVTAGAGGALIAAALVSASVESAVVLTAVGAALWPALAFICGLYSAGDLRTWITGVPDIRRLVFVALLVSWPMVAAATAMNSAHPVRTALTTSLLALCLSVGGRAGARGIAHRSERLRERTLIVGSGVVAAKVAQKLRTQTDAGLTPIGIVDDQVHTAVDLGVPCLGTLDELTEVLSRHAVERVVIAFSRATHEQLLTALRACRDRRVPVHVVPRLYEFLDGAPELDNVGGLPLLSLGVPRLSASSRAAKRTLDIVVSLFGLVATAPLLAIIAVAIRLESPGPVLFRQVRAGRQGTTFQLLKFRSMYEGAEGMKADLVAQNDLRDGVMFKIHRDPRVTRVGGLLRRFSLDELPQLLNVLLGQMSLVGPRPLVLPEADALSEHWHRRRQDLRPGLTGAWQVYGRSDIAFQDMVRLDYQYVSGWSLARDMEILLATAPAVISGRGAY